jgi:hypothetical protein
MRRVGNSNGTRGRAGVQNSSLFKLLRFIWNLEKPIATGTHNSEPVNHLGQPTKIGEHRLEVRECHVSTILSTGVIAQREPATSPTK